ncbi:MAG: helix-turn-helix domain-containing protein [Nocardioides sp.]
MSNGSELLKTGEVARLLGVSRQHVVDLCDRGDLRCVRVGTHRRVPRSEVVRVKGALTREQERSLWLHRALLGQVLADPEATSAKARENIERWRGSHRADGKTIQYLEEWERLLDSGLDWLVENLISPSPRACELRQNSPFAGILPQEARERVLASFNQHWADEHV